VAGILTLSNTAQAGADSILVDHLVLLGADRQRSLSPVGEAASSVEVYLRGSLAGQSARLTRDSTVATVSLVPALRVPPGTPVVLEVRWNTTLSQFPAAFRLGCDAAGIGVVQPSSALLQVRVSPAQGMAFPLWTTAGVFGNASLGESYSNFPNPFAAGAVPPPSPTTCETPGA